MTKIKINTKKYSNLFAKVDDKDYLYLNKFRWNVDPNGYAYTHCYKLGKELIPVMNIKNVYKFRQRDSMGRFVNTSNLPRSRVISMAQMLMGKTETGQEIDHVNLNKLDNRKMNLRKTNHSGNQHNRTKYSNNTSGYKGVFWYKDRKIWSAKIRVNGKLKNIGYFENRKEASMAYDKAALKFHGEHARTNIMPSL